MKACLPYYATERPHRHDDPENVLTCTLPVIQERKLNRVVTLEELKKHKDGAIRGMQLFTTARLSVQNVTKSEWEFVLSLEDTEPS